MMTVSDLAPTSRTAVRRKPERASYERSTVYEILDAAFVAHVGVTLDEQPFVMPMVYGRDEDRVLLHGSVASRLLRALERGLRVCVTVTIVDGLVLAASHRNHSVNYRSVVILGTARRLRGEDVGTALTQIVEHVVPGRAAEARPVNDAERRDVLVLGLDIEEASAKIRSGPPLSSSHDDPADGRWTGELPLGLVAGRPVADAASRDRAVPGSLTPWRRARPIVG
jgi:uncharacterized protein